MRLLVLSLFCLGFVVGCGGNEAATQNPTVQEKPGQPTKGADSPVSASAL